MGLAKRLEIARSLDGDKVASAEAASGQWRAPASVSAEQVTKPFDSPMYVSEPNEALSAVKERAGVALYERMGSRITDSSIEESELQQYVKDELRSIIEEDEIPLTVAERQRLVQEIIDDVLGLGPLEKFLNDADITEIMVNGPEKVYVERRGKLTLTGARFTGEEQLRKVIERIVTKVGRRIDESSPLVDARLADGSRVNAIIPRSQLAVHR
jgi:pilus assembly protein CpaF